ncbi:unnamed protein product [Rotaria magnacalcarata]|uniref:Uncharacterized protein n=1 Tax=Rotaria magnacalcarata TaxID=392030 RepID=A0A814HYS6_9BILA|nr:unnamed protein product [Rotaria magnacalcarata]CAF1686415.1 unnamed protein product [Rotaria magnacalcarata]CAF3938241.1 unnamed protein product [Rotaria magnacalcarata]CAF3968430.1 unnamed protein product [Rotaria magnacalcarata]CAF4045038.1 unnamed protein product [Rotaria magnacalcarata]
MHFNIVTRFNSSFRRKATSSLLSPVITLASKLDKFNIEKALCIATLSLTSPPATTRRQLEILRRALLFESLRIFVDGPLASLIQYE